MVDGNIWLFNVTSCIGDAVCYYLGITSVRTPFAPENSIGPNCTKF